MSDVTLNPIENINASNSSLVWAQRSAKNSISRYGSTLYRERLTKTLNSRGSVVGLSRTLDPVEVLIYDRMTSDDLDDTGVSRNSTVNNSKKEAPRAYMAFDTDVDEGDFLLINYDTDADTYDERYRVVEKEAHDVSGGVVFYTLYLAKEVD